MVKIPAEASVEVPLLSDPVCLDHISVWSVMQPCWPRLFRNIEDVGPPPPYLLVVIETVEDDIPLIVFAVNKWAT